MIVVHICSSKSRIFTPYFALSIKTPAGNDPTHREIVGAYAPGPGRCIQLK